MKTFLLSALFMLFSIAAFAQESTHAANQVYPVLGPGGQLWEYETSMLSGFFYPMKVRAKYKFKCLDNCVRVETVDGISQLYFVSHKGACAAGCYFAGSFDDYSQELVAENGYFVWRIAGSLTGTFTDPEDNVHFGTLARFHFETLPAGWQDMRLRDLAAGLGSFNVVLHLD